MYPRWKPVHRNDTKLWTVGCCSNNTEWDWWSQWNLLSSWSVNNGSSVCVYFINSNDKVSLVVTNWHELCADCGESVCPAVLWSVVGGQEWNPVDKDTTGRARPRMPLFFRKKKISDDSLKRLEYQICLVWTICCHVIHQPTQSSGICSHLFCHYDCDLNSDTSIEETDSVSNYDSSLFRPRRRVLMTSWTSQRVSSQRWVTCLLPHKGSRFIYCHHKHM